MSTHVQKYAIGSEVSVIETFSGNSWCSDKYAGLQCKINEWDFNDDSYCVIFDKDKSIRWLESSSLTDVKMDKYPYIGLIKDRKHNAFYVHFHKPDSGTIIFQRDSTWKTVQFRSDWDEDQFESVASLMISPGEEIASDLQRIILQNLI